jgi:hypothetical protein
VRGELLIYRQFVGSIASQVLPTVLFWFTGSEVFTPARPKQ